MKLVAKPLWIAAFRRAGIGISIESALLNKQCHTIIVWIIQFDTILELVLQWSRTVRASRFVSFIESFSLDRFQTHSYLMNYLQLTLTLVTKFLSCSKFLQHGSSWKALPHPESPWFQQINSLGTNSPLPIRIIKVNLVNSVCYLSLQCKLYSNLQNSAQFPNDAKALRPNARASKRIRLDFPADILLLSGGSFPSKKQKTTNCYNLAISPGNPFCCRSKLPKNGELRCTN